MAFQNYERIIKEQKETIAKQNEKIVYLEGKITELIQEKISAIKNKN